MIEHNFGVMTLHCDSCPAEGNVGFDRFDQLRDFAHKHGWKCEKVNGEWIHTCPDCRKANKGGHIGNKA